MTAVDTNVLIDACEKADGRLRRKGLNRQRSTFVQNSVFRLRIQPSLLKGTAKADGIAVNRLIAMAVAEKVSALRMSEYFAERAARGDIKKALRVLKGAGRGNPPMPGDELPPRSRRRPATRRSSRSR